MKIEEIKIGQKVEVRLGNRPCHGVVEYLHPPRGSRIEWNVQVDVSGITWLGTPDKVRAV